METENEKRRRGRKKEMSDPVEMCIKVDRKTRDEFQKKYPGRASYMLKYFLAEAIKKNGIMVLKIS